MLGQLRAIPARSWGHELNAPVGGQSRSMGAGPALRRPTWPGSRASRLEPGDDLRRRVEDTALAHGWGAAFVVAGIGSLRPAALRFAGADQASVIDRDLELLSLTGSLSPHGAHLHMSVSDETGQVLGGHVAYGCRVRTTVELLITVLPGWRFTRELDTRTGFSELVVRPARGG